MKIPKNLVDHPRYGSHPRMTGLDFSDGKPGLNLSWKYSGENGKVIPNTGIEADISKQYGATLPIDIYYDILKKCVDCERHFIFFAEEQRYWYEVLRFSNDADCIRCIECRQKRQSDDRLNFEYQRLLEKKNKDWRDYYDLSVTAMDLFDLGGIKNLDKVRCFFNSIPESEHHCISIRNLKDRISNA